MPHNIEGQQSNVERAVLALPAYGLRSRGQCLLMLEEAGELAAMQGAGVLLVGHAGSELWPVFSTSPEYLDAHPDALDRWSVRVGSLLAERFSAQAVYPFGGPPYAPFQRWAARAEGLGNSQLGMSIHAEYGVWHAYRFALLFPRADLIDTSESLSYVSPKLSAICSACDAKPCVAACPVSAFSDEGYDVDACAHYLFDNDKSDCQRNGCLSRRACPVGQTYTYEAAHAAFHMAAFVDARKLKKE